MGEGASASERVRVGPRGERLQRAVTFAEVDIDRPHLDAVPRVADDLRRRVEAHRLAVQQRAGEDGG